MAPRFPLILPCLIPHVRYQALTRTLCVRHPQFTGSQSEPRKSQATYLLRYLFQSTRLAPILLIYLLHSVQVSDFSSNN